MRAIIPGHKYALDSFENGPAQTLQFIWKEPKAEGSTELFTLNDGTTNEEVLAMLIDRLQYLNRLLPSRQTSIAITKCQEALMWLNERTLERRTRGVEGKHQP